MSIPRMPRFLWAVTVLGTVITVAAMAAGPEGASMSGAVETPATLADLSFLEGRWRADYNGRILDEQFSAPDAGTMVGLFRWINDGATTFTEHLTIEQRDDGIHLFVRHFNPGSIPWEAKDEPLHFQLDAMSDGRAVFTAPDRLFPASVTYHRTQPGHLVVRLDGHREDGTGREMEFNFRSNEMTTHTENLTEAGQSMGYNGGLTIAFSVKDLKASADWYQNVLGFKMLYQMDEFGWCELSSPVAKVNVGLSQVENPTAGGPTATFGVEDIEHARAKLEGQGVKFDGETREYPGMVKLATFYDPDGNTLMLFQSLSEG